MSEGRACRTRAWAAAAVAIHPASPNATSANKIGIP
jgi:hypothetical protein